MHKLTENIKQAGWPTHVTLDEIITDWLREKAALINFFKHGLPDGYCYPSGEGILGLEAKKGAPQDNSESRTWPCEHILRTPKWTPGLCEWSYFGSSGVDHEAKWCEFCGAKRPEPKIWCSHIKLKGDTWRYEYISQNDPLISYQVTIEDYENFCRVCGKERPR